MSSLSVSKIMRPFSLHLSDIGRIYLADEGNLQLDEAKRFFYSFSFLMRPTMCSAILSRVIAVAHQLLLKASCCRLDLNGN